MPSLVRPLVPVTGPAITQARYGLFSVAQPQQSTDRHIFYGGVEYEPVGCLPAHVVPSGAGQCPLEPVQKEADGWPDTIVGLPFAVYHRVDVASIGHTADEVLQRLDDVLVLNSQHAVEEAFFTGDYGNGPGLAAGDAVQVLAGGDTLDNLRDGIGTLEEWLGHNYAGVGVLHAPRRVGAYADYITTERASQLQTHLGNLWVFGTGYPNQGPDGTPAAAGTAWIYATGQVQLWRGEAVKPAGWEAALDRTTNHVLPIIEQPYVLTRDCGVAAVQVTLPAPPAPANI